MVGLESNPVRFIGALALLLVALATGAAFWLDAWMGRREADRIRTATTPIPLREFAIVPGAKVLPDGRASDALEDRLATALDLWRAGTVRRILVSGRSGPPGRDEIACMTGWLRDHRVPDAVVVVDPLGIRTLQTMKRAASLFRVHEAILCTQAFHLPRALWLARAAGIDVLGVVADRRVYDDAFRNRAREFLARTRAFIDVTILREMDDPDGGAAASDYSQ